MKDLVIYILLDYKLRKHLSTSVMGILRFSGCPELALRVSTEGPVDSRFINSEHSSISTMAKDLPVFDGCVYSTSSSNPRSSHSSLRPLSTNRRQTNVRFSESLQDSMIQLQKWLNPIYIQIRTQVKTPYTKKKINCSRAMWELSVVF